MHDDRRLAGRLSGTGDSVAAVRIEEVAFSDVRVQALADLAGYANAYEALGRLAHLWRHCTQRQAYVVSEPIVRACMGPNGVDALLGSELAERTAEGIRVKGTEGRIEWLETARENGRKGGRPRKKPDQNQTETGSKPEGFDLQTQIEPEPNPITISLAPALAQIDTGGALSLAEVEQLGFPKCNQLGGSSAVAIKRLMPIYRHEIEDALKTKGTSWKYIAKVIESQRLEASRPPAPGARSPPQGSSSPAWGNRLDIDTETA
jgi:hypothetical protein